MRGKALPFHIQQNTSPEVLRAILARCYDGRVTISDLAQELAMCLGTVQHIVPFVRQSGLLNSTGLSLTDLGAQFYHFSQQSPDMLAEAMHHLLYTAHTFDPTKRFSWAYARVVDALWARGDCILDRQTTAELVGMVVEEASQKFGVPVEKIAFSHNSVRGVLNWLRALEPSVIEREDKSNRFRRRHFCSPSVFLWAVDFIYRAHCTAHGVRMFLTPERIEQLCKLCVLDPSGLENVLMMVKRTSDYDRGGVFDYGTEGGFGRWILLTRPCPVPTFPEGNWR